MALLQGKRPDPPPLETDDARTVAVGTGAWLLGLAVLVVLRVTDATRVETWWMVMCACGAGLGALGVWFCRRRQAAIARDKARGIPQRD